MPTLFQAVVNDFQVPLLLPSTTTFYANLVQILMGDSSGELGILDEVMILIIVLLESRLIDFPLLLLLIRNPSRFGLTVLHLPEINPDSSVAEGVGLRRAAVLLVRRPQPPDQGVEAAPRLPQRAGAGRRRVGLPEEDATMQVNLSLSELVEVAEKFEHVVAIAVRERDWRPLVLEVLSEGVPVPPLLGLVAAERRRRRVGAGGALISRIVLGHDGIHGCFW